MKEKEKEGKKEQDNFDDEDDMGLKRRSIKRGKMMVKMTLTTMMKMTLTMTQECREELETICSTKNIENSPGVSRPQTRCR